MSVVVALATRYLLVCLFFPFSALDKIINFEGAKDQAKELIADNTIATGLILSGLAVEIAMPLAILFGIVDHFAAFVLAGYCCVTAMLWKMFWRPGDFWVRGDSKGRNLFWDFMKNLSLAGGFLLLAFGLRTGESKTVLQHPLASSHYLSNGRS